MSGNTGVFYIVRRFENTETESSMYALLDRGASDYGAIYASTHITDFCQEVVKILRRRGQGSETRICFEPPYQLSLGRTVCHRYEAFDQQTRDLLMGCLIGEMQNRT